MSSLALVVQQQPTPRPRLPMLPERVECPRHQTIADVEQRLWRARLRGQTHHEMRERLDAEKARCFACSGRCRQGEPLTRREALSALDLVTIGIDRGYVARMLRLHGAECLDALGGKDPGCGRLCMRTLGSRP